MAHLIKNRKKALVLAVVFILLGGFFVLGVPQAKAQFFEIAGSTILKAVSWILIMVLQPFFSKLLTLAAGALEAVFSISKFKDIPVVTIGWQITRGLCNMFFALILLVMAFSTILQIERFGMKQILKRLVIAALLINFSLLFAGILIDFSQVLTDYFIKEAQGTKGISAQITNGLNISRAYDANPSDKTVPIDFCSDQCNPNEVCQAFPDTDEYGCAPAPNPNTNPAAALKQGDQGAIQVVIGAIFSIILLLVASFVILAAAIFMIFRIIMLWFLLIFAPLAWLSMITGTGGLWGKWWGLFFKWTFFAPVYAFFIYLAVVAASTGSIGKAFGSPPANIDPGILNSLAGGNIMMLFQYIIIVMILLGGLIAAQQMGIAGASTAMGLAKKASGKVQGWATGSAKWTGKQAMRAPKFAWNEKVAPGLTSAAGKALSFMQLKKWGGRTQAAAVQMKQKPTERPENKAYAEKLKFMSDKDLLHETKAAWGARALIAAREAKERGTLAKTDDKESVKKAMQTFASYGAKGTDGKTKEQRDLEETRFDVFDPTNKEEGKQQKDAIRRSYESGNLAKVNAVVFKDKETTKAMADELSPPEFVETYKKLNKAAKFAIKGGTDKDGNEIKGSLSENFDDKSDFSASAPDMKYRNLFAAATGNLAKSFTSASDEMSKAAETAAAKFVKGMKASQIGDIFEGEEDGRKSLEMVGRHIDRTLLASTTGELNAMQKQIITSKEGIKRNEKQEDLEDYMSKSPAWGGRVPEVGQQAAGGARPQPQRPERGGGPSF